MTWNKLSILGIAACLGSFAGCDDEVTVTFNPDAAVTLDGATDVAVTPRDTAADTGGDAMTTLYQRLGGAAGINVVVTDFVVNRVLQNPKINGYFLNSTVDGGNVIRCLKLQLGNATGGPEMYPATGCRDMKKSHAGLGISKIDFDDLVADLVAALNAANVAPGDIGAIRGALLPMQADIVEDPANNITVYQRLGRKPAIAAVIEKFVGRVAGDIRINGFFGTTALPRLKTCLTRQVAGIDGPVKYGQEVDTDATKPGAEPGVSKMAVCKDMLTVHKGLAKPAAVGAGAPILKEDFDALVDDLDKTFSMDFPTVPAADVNLIKSKLAPMCSDIVAGPGCGGTAYGLTSDSKLVTFDVAPPATGTTPITVSAPIAITGLAASETLYSITVRPVDGKLFGLGNTSRIYVINPTTGAATVVGTAALSPVLSGSYFGFDFNPTVDKIRIVSDTETNFRADPVTGMVLPAPPAPGVADVPLTPAGNVVAVAYTNSFAASMKTTLYGIDTSTPTAPKLIRIGGIEAAPSPNAGNVVDVGPLGVATTANSCIDIRKAMTFAYAVLETTAGKSTLYTVNLTTGAATKVADLGVTPVLLRSIALAQ